MVIAESIILFFQNAALPALYSAVTFTSIDELGQFYQCLSMADQKWDSIHWTPYSAPGRWVLELDLSNLAFEGAKQALHLDSLVTQLFPLTPFLRCLSIVPSFVMSRRATRGCCQFTYIGRFFIFATTTDTPRWRPPLFNVQALRHLTIIGQGFDSSELELIFEAFVGQDEGSQFHI